MTESFSTDGQRDLGGSIATGDFILYSVGAGTITTNPYEYIPDEIGEYPYGVSYDPVITDTTFKNEIKKLKKKIKKLKEELEVIKTEFIFNKLNDPSHGRNKE